MRGLIVSLITVPLLSSAATSGAQSVPRSDGADPAWSAPACAGATPSGTRRIAGDKMQFAVPTSLKVRTGFDVDYGMNSVCVGRHCLRHGFGPLWSSGTPGAAFFTNVAELKKRDVPDRWSATKLAIEYSGEEYRGRRTNGTYFRFLGLVGETVEYDGVPRDAAEILDRVIDSLCWRTEG